MKLSVFIALFTFLFVLGAEARKTPISQKDINEFGQRVGRMCGIVGNCSTAPGTRDPGQIAVKMKDAMDIHGKKKKKMEASALVGRDRMSFDGDRNDGKKRPDGDLYSGAGGRTELIGDPNNPFMSEDGAVPITSEELANMGASPYGIRQAESFRQAVREMARDGGTQVFDTYEGFGEVEKASLPEDQIYSRDRNERE